MAYSIQHAADISDHIVGKALDLLEQEYNAAAVDTAYLDIDATGQVIMTVWEWNEAGSQNRESVYRIEA